MSRPNRMAVDRVLRSLYSDHGRLVWWDKYDAASDEQQRRLERAVVEYDEAKEEHDNGQ